jgi:hypothetical protein
MADTLFESLSGLNFTPAENPYGIAATSIGQVAPQLITPYTSTGRAVGIGLGSILLQSLLGYQARSQAAQDTLQANTLANQMMSMTTPQARTEFIGGVEDPMYQSRLSTLATALNQQEVARKAKAAEKLLEAKSGFEAQLSPEGTAVFKREQEALLNRALALRAPTGGGADRAGRAEEKDWFDKLPAAQKVAFGSVEGQVSALRDLAQQYRALGANAIEYNIQKQIPGSAADLAESKLQTLVSGTVKMLGDTGNIAQQEQENIKAATLGGRLSGSESIAARLEQLADMAESKTISSLEQFKTAYTQGGDVLLQQIKTGAPAAATAETPTARPAEADQKLQILRQLQAELAAEKAKRGL